MGWTFYLDNPRLTRAEMIAREFEQKPTYSNPWAFGVHMIAERGSTVYAIMWRENTRDGVAREYFGEVILTQRRRGEFGYKNIGEDCGPYYFDCPVRILDELDRIAPVPEDSTAAGWRVRCRAKHAERRARARTQWAPGQRVRFSPPGDVFELIAPAGPRRGWHVRRLCDGAAFRAPAARFTRAEIVKG